MKSWRNKSPGDKQPFNGLDENGNVNNEIDDVGPFPQQSPNNHQSSQLNNSIQVKEESFSVSVYILLILTLAVIILFYCYYKKRNTVRTRRKCFPFNKLGF